jgi:diguanylate cyclase (GGDEF)-like protein
MAEELMSRLAEANLKVRLWNSVPVRLGLGVLLITWAALGFGFLLIEKQLEQQLHEQYVRTASRESLIVVSSLAERMVTGEGHDVWNEISTEAAQHRDVIDAANVRVFTGAGIVKAASDSATIGTRIAVSSNPDCPSCDSTRPGDFPADATITASGGARSLRIVNPIPVTQPCLRCHRQKASALGFISIDYDLWPLERETARRRRDMLATGLVAGILVMAVTALLFRLLVMRSVRSIARSARHLEKGNLAARAQVVGNNELALLALNFNHMAERVDAAHTESELLYTLVVEASKTLEIGEMAAGLARVLMQELRPRRVTFFLETDARGWICASRGSAGEEETASGEDALEAALVSGAENLQPLLVGAPGQIVADACRTQKLQLTSDTAETTFVLPAVADKHLVGLLICIGVPATIRMGEHLLETLGTHLALVASNSRNYTGAITDGLTRLKNKRYGLIRLDEAVYTAKRYEAGLGLVMCDIDHFKRINDSYGHQAGDAVLKEVSRRIAMGVRQADIAVRYGGEEFMLILPKTEVQQLAGIGEKIRQAVAASPVNLRASGVSLPLTISVGVAALHPDRDSGETLIARADAALYRAKEGGRNRVELDP